MNYGLSDQVRAQAREAYVRPAIGAGKSRFPISVRDLQRDLEARGFPPNHTRQVCKALTSNKFLRENDIEIEAVDGPPSKTSTTVVVHYRISQTKVQIAHTEPPSGEGRTSQNNAESAEERARRLGGRLRGLLKDELAEYGGGEAFIRWVRGYDEEDAA